MQSKQSITKRNLGFSYLSIFLALGIVVFYSGCASKKKPAPKERTWTIEQLESKYREIQEKPKPVSLPSINTQKRDFDKKVKTTFKDIGTYQKEVAYANVRASASAKKEEDEKKRDKERKDIIAGAKTKEANNGIINSYYE